MEKSLMADTIAALKQADGNRTPERTPMATPLVTPTVSGSPLQHVARAKSNDVPLVLESMEAEEQQQQAAGRALESAISTPAPAYTPTPAAARSPAPAPATAPVADEDSVNGDGAGDELQELTLALAKNGQRLGMSIAGGADDRVQPDDTRIYITAILEGGAAMADGRLRTGDIILAVDEHDVRDVPHSAAVQRLSEAADPVMLTIGRYEDEVRGRHSDGENVGQHLAYPLFAAGHHLQHHLSQGGSRPGLFHCWRT